MNSDSASKALESALKSGLVDQVPRASRFALLEAAGVPKIRARTLAGYSSNTTPHTITSSAKYRQAKQAIRERRAELSERRGYRLEDSARFYREKSENTKAERLRRDALAILQDGAEDAAERAKVLLEQAQALDVGDAAQIRARERLDRLLGYDSPLEVEHDGAGGDVSPVVMLLDVLSQLNLSPLQARAVLGDESPGNTIEDGQYSDVAGGEYSQAEQQGEGMPADARPGAEGCRHEDEGVGGGSDSEREFLERDPFPGPEEPKNGTQEEAIP